MPRLNQSDDHQSVRGLPWQGVPESFYCFQRKRAVSADACRGGGSCKPSDRAHFTKTASIKLEQDRCSRAAASRIHRIQAGEPRTDNPGCALIPPPVAVLTFPPPVRELFTSSREHSSKPQPASGCKSFSCKFLQLARLDVKESSIAPLTGGAS